ncbi:hypothetical protein GCK32_013186 [Trichostrongylus colubriformis]|uniref:Uncharacterized protein n=1 Tax=Trichostrongylus colubriformis TaxID=6319 RepID=A0AAN8G8M3_TRICO
MVYDGLENWFVHKADNKPFVIAPFTFSVDDVLLSVAGREHPQYGRPNILTLKYLDEVARINQYIIHNITVPVDIDGKHYEAVYTDLCMSFDWACYHNDHLTMLMPKSRWGNFSGPIAEFASDIINSEVCF